MLRLKLREFIKVQLGAISGSMADFLITFLCTEIFFIWYIVSSVMGNISGGLVQFCISRSWIFRNSRQKIGWQIFKYILFFFGNILLSASGTYLFTQTFHIHYLVSKLLTSVLFGLTYNYYLQKYFVFR